jgi:ubiquinone/menaquinone biosynthesis C-methylase UbiE
MQGIVDLASAYYGSAVLFAALEADLFTAVAQHAGQTDAATVAAARGLDPRGARLLLDACVAIGLLAKQGDTYANTPAGALALTAGAPHDLRGAIRYNRDVYPAWGRLAELARTGRPVEAPSIHLGDDPQRTRSFALAMHGRALGIGRCVVPMLDLAGCRRLLDLAGGPGTYAVLMAQAHPSLNCETVDLPAIAAVAAELVARTEVAARVTCRAGDYHVDRYDAGAYDAVTIFGALHQESPEMIRDIAKRTFAALRPGGQLFVLDLMTDGSHTSPPFSALFAVNMALTTDNGWVFSDEELRSWLTEAGFTDLRTQPVPPPMPHWLVSARKPAVHTNPL